MSKTPAKNIYPILFAIMMIPVMNSSIFDNDTWWLLALGRNIISSGIPTIEPLSMHEGLAFVSQQWLSATIFQGLFSVFGYAGLIAFCQILFAAIICLIYRYCTLGSGNRKVSAIVTLAAAIFMATSSFRIRPQMFTFVILLTELIILEKYRQTNNWKHLIWLPVLSVLEVNLHSSMWTMLFIFMLPLYAEWVARRISVRVLAKKKVNLTHRLRVGVSRFRIIPLTAAAVAAALAGLLNPYGIKSMIYLFSSYNEDTQQIMEMRPLSWEASKPIFVVLIATLVIICVSRKKLPVSYWGLYAGTGLLTLTAVKGSTYFVMASALLVSCSLKDVRLKDRFTVAEKYRKTLLCILLCCILSLTVVSDITTCVRGDYSHFDATGVVAYLKQNYEVDENSKLYADYNTGGYFEFAGMKPYIDARAEVFLKVNNKKEDYLAQYFAAEENPLQTEPFIELYKFEYIVAYKNGGVSAYLNYTEGENGYSKVYETTDEDYPLELWVSDTARRSVVASEGN